MIERLLLGLIAFGLPYAVLFLAFYRLRRKERNWSRAPFSEKILRPPGESLRLQLLELQDRRDEIALQLSGILIFPGIALVTVPVENRASIIFLATFAVGCFLIAFFHWRKLLQVREKFRNYELGFEGERYVASELNILLKHGYHVFHDFVFDMNPGGNRTTFNIDHIAIGPAGLIVIETKTRRKPLQITDPNQANHEVISDGNALTLPGGYRDRKPITQVQASAQQLHRWLTVNLNATIPTTPIVVMPGWLVKRKSESPVLVLSGKELVPKITRLPRARISVVELDHYSHLLESHSRNLDPQ